MQILQIATVGPFKLPLANLSKMLNLLESPLKASSVFFKKILGGYKRAEKSWCYCLGD